MNEAREKLLEVINFAEKAIKYIDREEKRLCIGMIDELEFESNGAKWIVINKVIDEEGEF